MCDDDDDDNDGGEENEMACTNFEQDDIFEDEEEDVKDKNREEMKRPADEGSDENDSLLVGYDTDSVISL